MTGPVIPFNATTPAGRAILHLIDKSALADVADGIEVRSTDHWDDHGGRQMIVHPQFDAWCSRGEGALISLVAAFATDIPVRLRAALEDVDDRSRRAIVEAVMIAAGLSGAVTVAVPA